MLTKDFLYGWLDNRAYALAPRTVESYRDSIRLHIVPEMGQIELSALTALEIESVIGRLCRAGQSRTALLVYTVLRTAFKDAVRLRLIHDNPMDAVMRPKHQPQMRRWLNSEEIAVYIAAVMRDRYKLAWLLAICCGLRRGEICGLRWGDVDLSKNCIHIRNQRVTLRCGTIDSKPKSASGERDIAMPEELLPMLGQACYRDPRGYVITTQSGQPMKPNYLDKRHREMIQAYGLPPVTPHGLRHTMATQAIEQGVHIRVLQYLMGHASYTTTATVYAHVDRAAASAAIGKIAENVLKYTRSHPDS